MAYTVRQVQNWWRGNRYVQQYQELRESRRNREVNLIYVHKDGSTSTRGTPVAGNMAYGQVLAELERRWPGSDQSHYNLPLAIPLGPHFAGPAKFSITMLSRFCFGSGGYFTIHAENQYARMLLDCTGMQEWRQDYTHISVPGRVTWTPEGVLAYVQQRLLDCLFPPGMWRAVQMLMRTTRPETRRKVRHNINGANGWRSYQRRDVIEDEMTATRVVLRRLRRRHNIVFPQYPLNSAKHLAKLLRAGPYKEPVEAHEFPDVWDILDGFDGDLTECESLVYDSLPATNVLYY